MIEIIETKEHLWLAALNEEIQTFHHIIQPKVFKPFDYETVSNFFRTTLAESNTVAFVAREHETLIGYVLLYKVDVSANPFQYARSYVLLDQILVLSQHRRKGVGKLLLDAAVSFAKKENINLMELNHWTQNESARKFFGEHNFEYYNEKMWMHI